MLPAALRRVTDGVTPYFCLLLAVVTLGPHQFGFHLAELNAPQDVITCHQKGILANTIPGTTLPECIPMTEAQFATVSSVFTIGGLIGALVAGPFCSREGRLLAMRLTAVVFLLGSVTETFAPSVAVLAIGRVLNGLSAGASTVIVPLYISEVAPVQSRGFFGAFTQITVNIGILFTQTLGFFLSHGSAWRFILGTGIALSLVQFVGLLVVPESPAWLAARGGEGKTLQAKRILQRIRGKTVDLDDEVAHWPSAGSAEEQALLDQNNAAAAGTTDFTTTAAEEYETEADDAASLAEGIVAVAPPSPRGPVAMVAKGKTKAPVGFFELVVDAHYRPALIAVIGIMFAQQVCGINSVIMYSVSLLNGMLPLNSALLTIIISCVNLVTTILSAPLPDRLGRKTCLMLSVVGQGTSSLVLAFSIVYGVKILSAFSVLAFVAFFAVGLGPVPFILASELVGQEAVGATQSWALGANYVATFLVAQFFPIVNTALNNRFGGAGWVYFLFALFATLSTVFFWFYVPETNGKKDADEVWGRTSRTD